MWSSPMEVYPTKRCVLAESEKVEITVLRACVGTDVVACVKGTYPVPRKVSQTSRRIPGMTVAVDVGALAVPLPREAKVPSGPVVKQQHLHACIAEERCADQQLDLSSVRILCRECVVEHDEVGLAVISLHKRHDCLLGRVLPVE